MSRDEERKGQREQRGKGEHCKNKEEGGRGRKGRGARLKKADLPLVPG